MASRNRLTDCLHLRLSGALPVSRIQTSTIFAAAVRLQEWMDETLSITSMTEQDRRISEVIAEERSRLRNFIRTWRPENFTDAAVIGEDGDLLEIEDLLPSPDAGPEALCVRNVLLDELERALGELPDEQREVFVAHELEGRSFQI